ncbi:hypothetical protein DL770_011524 [Monosporascus sp. CRB-9-2]|nr:hypothetical protein DL770_011524 [Monosporascus sp. CRB-9-2]
MPDIAPLATPINGKAAAGMARGAACAASPAFGFSLSCEAKYTASAIRNTANAVAAIENTQISATERRCTGCRW